MSDQNDALIDAITEVMPHLLTSMEALHYIGRHLHPTKLNQLMDQVGNADAEMREGLRVFQAAEWPDHLTRFKETVELACASVEKAFDGLRSAPSDPQNAVLRAYRALRYSTQAMEALYPVAAMLPPVSRFYLEPDRRDDEELVQKLEQSEPTRENVGVLHANNDKKERGGFSIYIPEYYNENEAYPVIIAMHGGSGHGRDFLWTWIREARSRGVILISPSSRGDTWALMGPDIDSENLDRILGHVRETWNVDENKMLLTGMSDGGTFSYVSGLRKESPMTHLAPISSSFHPMLLEMADHERLQGLPVYVTHGALDWMFPIDMARGAHESLKAAGARVTYSEIGDLSHTYPREENAKIMDWLLS